MAQNGTAKPLDFVVGGHAERHGVLRVSPGGKVVRSMTSSATGAPPANTVVATAHSMRAAAALSAAAIEREFRDLAMQWRSETRHVSMEWQLIFHPAYQRIMTFGWRAVPLILCELRDFGGNWYHALELITQAKPDPAADARSEPEARAAWLEWGRRQRLLA